MFQACGKSNWDSAREFLPGAVSERMNGSVGGIKIAPIGMRRRARPGHGPHIRREDRPRVILRKLRRRSMLGKR
ncbi:unnamed protein product [marine sediment metagenome]|uniref:Uncharacterized protein n=1 Tax=marine sediment metagenome TaxID=412755 RepID=X1K748_9ZZZZ